MITLEFDFTHKENDSESQAVYDANRNRLNKVCKKVHEALLTGIELSASNFFEVTGASEFRRRFKDLLDAGYPVKSKPVGGGLKAWFYDTDYINSQK